MSVVVCLSGKKPCDRWLIWNIICAEHKFNKEKEGGGSRIHWENLYVWGRQFSSLIRKKKPRHKPQQLRKDRSLCCIIWQETSTVLSDRGVRMIGRTRAHTRAPTNTHTHCLYFLLFSLVCFPSRDEPLADRTGPLGSCYRPPQRTDWKALIAALRSPQSRENRSLSVIGSLSWDAGKRVNEGAKRENERQVRHPVRVNYWEKKRRRERGWQRLSNRQFQRETKAKEITRVFVSLSSHSLPGKTVADIGDGTWVVSEAKAYATWQTRIQAHKTTTTNNNNNVSAFFDAHSDTSRISDEDNSRLSAILRFSQF